MRNASRLDREICETFLNNWDDLIAELAEIKNRMEISQPEMNETSEMPSGGERAASRKERIGQAFFRRAILSAYNSAYCITGINIPALLRASHIKPWAKSNDINEKTNPQNGLLLNALHDVAFDKGLITISVDYRVVVSPLLLNAGEKNNFYFLKYDGQKITLPTKFLPAREFIEYHNKEIFLK